MGKPYASEIQALPGTVDWANKVEIGELSSFVAEARGRPTVCVGSGGSMTVAHFATMLHRNFGRGFGRHATPLEVLLDEPTLSDCAVLLLSASGKNRDVIAACDAAIRAEVPALGVICTRSGSPLAKSALAYSRANVLEADGPFGKDGFLATNSLIASLVVLARAYGTAPIALPNDAEIIGDVDLGDRDALLVLHAGWSAPAATDLESRLHESALAGVQISDYRNFGHGRHLWLATRPKETAVLALETPETSDLAKRTLELIPDDVPVVRFRSEKSGPLAAIDLISAEMGWCGSVAAARGIDPGRPHVPEFGRRIFRVPPPKSASRLPGDISVAVKRKLDRIGASNSHYLQIYKTAHERFLNRLSSAKLGAVVLDYDGTLCDDKHRFGQLPEEVTISLRYLLDLGLFIGIATGRGKSVRESLRQAIPKKSWSKVLVGYYNGGAIIGLDSDKLPDRDVQPGTIVYELEAFLRKDEILGRFTEIEVRPKQITLSSHKSKTRSPIDIHAYLLDIIPPDFASSVKVLRSKHSVDIVGKDVSKMSVVRQLESIVAPRFALCIGDNGAQPGNDHELLRHKFSLSVDQVSADPQSCWNIAPIGCVGVPATLAYLRAINAIARDAAGIDPNRVGRTTE